MTDHRWSQELVSSERCSEVAVLLRKLRLLVTFYMEQDENWDGFEGSPAATETIAGRGAGKDFEIAVGSSRSVMNVSLFAAIQQIDAIAYLFLADNPPVYSITALARSVIEISARVWWLADPDCDYLSRIRRVLIERLASAFEVGRLEKANGLEAGKLGAPPPLDDLIAEVKALGFDCKATSPNVSVGDDVRPGATSLISDFLREDMPDTHRSIYALTSAVTHGTLWGLMIYFTGGEPDEMRKIAATYRPTQNWLDGPANTSALAISYALGRIVALLGWSRHPLDAFLTECDDLFGELGDTPVA